MLLLAAAMLLPFLPGTYDGLATTISVSVQLIGVVGLLFVPIGAPWLVHEALGQRWVDRDPRHAGKRHRFALAAVAVGCVVAGFIALAGSFTEGLSFGILVLALSAYALRRLLLAAWRMKGATDARFHAVPVYLVVVPIVALVLQLRLAGPATEYSRNRAIAASATMIEEIEAYRAAHGTYPESLLGINKDYHPSVAGIERYEYARRGDTYDLVFEQPLFLLDELGAREFVVYNPRDEHVIMSHVVWNLVWSPEEAARNQGWFSAHETGTPHWKYFWFD